MTDIDSRIRECLDAAVAFDVISDPRDVRAKVARRQRRIRRRGRTIALLGVLSVAGATVGVVRVVDRDSAGDVAVRPDQPAITRGAQPQYLVPGWLPEGVAPIQAQQFGKVPERGGEAVAYGRADAADPWAGPVVAAFHIVRGPDTFLGDALNDGPTIGGHHTRMLHDDHGWWMEWSVDGDMIVVHGIGVSREQVIAAAEAASTEPAIDPAGLPSGLTELARGPLDAALPWGGLSYTGSSPGLWVSYGEAVGTDDSKTMLITQRRQETAAVVDLFRLAYPETRPVDIRGQHAILGRDTTRFVALHWYEPSGLLVTLTAYGLTEDTLREVAEKLREAGSDQVDRLLVDHPACPTRGRWTDC